LLRRGYEPTRFIGDIFDARGNNRAAVHPRQKVAVAEFVQIFADRLGGNFVSPGEVLDADPSRDPRERDNLCLACRKIVHHVDLTGWSTVSSVTGDNTGSGARAGSLEIDARTGRSRPGGRRLVSSRSPTAAAGPGGCQQYPPRKSPLLPGALVDGASRQDYMPAIPNTFWVPAPLRAHGTFCVLWVLGKGRPPPDAESVLARGALAS